MHACVRVCVRVCVRACVLGRACEISAQAGALSIGSGPRTASRLANGYIVIDVIIDDGVMMVVRMSTGVVS